jgi:hypothetical protein
MLTARFFSPIGSFTFGSAGGLLLGAATYVVPFAVTLPMMLAAALAVRAAFVRAQPERPDLAARYIDLLIGLAVGATSVCRGRGRSRPSRYASRLQCIWFRRSRADGAAARDGDPIRARDKEHS